MSDGVGSGKSKTGLIGAIIGAVIVGLMVLGYGLCQHSIHYQDAARDAAYYASDAQDQIRRECLPLPAAAERQCAREANNAARQNQREEYDLYAQQAVALWTAIMGGMAIVGIGLSSVGVYLIWQTWGETQKGASAAASTLNAYIAAERGAITALAGQASIEGTADPAIKVGVKIRNDGKAKARVNHFAFTLTDRPIWPEYFIESEEGEQLIDCESATWLYGTYPNPRISGVFYIAGYINYLTLGGLSYQTHFFFSASGKYLVNDYEWIFEVFPNWCRDKPADT